MAERAGPPNFDEHPGERRPRHLRIDDRPAVRDLDHAQLAAEALTALRAERVAPPEPERPGLVPWDEPPPSSGPTTAGDPSGRHRAAGRPVVFSPHTRDKDDIRWTASGPVVGRPARRAAVSRDDAPVTAPSLDRPRVDPASPIPHRWPRRRSVLVAAGVLILVGIGVWAVVLIRSAGADTAPAGEATVSVGAPQPAPRAPAATERVTEAPPAPVETPAPTSATSRTGEVGSAARETDRPTPAPAVLSTLAPGDAGFGWPTTAFGQPG